MSRETVMASVVKVSRDKLEELHRISRQADKLAAELERSRSLMTAALVVLMAHDTGTLASGHMEALRKALREANQ